MTFLKKLFSGAKKQATIKVGPMPTRKINFTFPLLPENGSKLANIFIDTVKKNENLSLDFSVDSIKFVDKFLQRYSDEGMTVNDFAETIAVAGIFIGEILVNNNNGVWIKHEEANVPNGVNMMPIVIKLPNGYIVDPIAKAFKRFYFGESDSIGYFYHVFTKT